MKKTRMTVGLKRVMGMLAVIVAVALWTPAVCSPLPVMAADTSAQDGEIALAVSLFRGTAEESMSFETVNMFPGDAVTKNYMVKTSYKNTATLNFHVEIEDGHDKLAEVLKCEVALVEAVGDTVLYDGLMKDMPSAVAIALQNAGKTTEELQYAITVYLDTSVTSEYQNQALKADFVWWLESAASQYEEKDDSDSQGTQDSTENDGRGAQDSTGTGDENSQTDTEVSSKTPETGDSNHLTAWSLLAGVLLWIISFLAVANRKEAPYEK